MIGARGRRLIRAADVVFSAASRTVCCHRGHYNSPQERLNAHAIVRGRDGRSRGTRATVKRAGLVVALGIGIFLTACAPQPSAPPQLTLEPVALDTLPGWQDDDPRPALAAFRASCARWHDAAPDGAFGRQAAFGTLGAWQAACNTLPTSLPDAAAGRAYLSAQFRAYAVNDGNSAEGLFTGYFEPELAGARQPGGRFTTPLRALPDNLISVDLGDFDADLAGRRLIGRVEGGAFVPYPDRAGIDAGAIDREAEALYYVDDPVAKFFLQIQGSGRVVMPDGALARVGYAGQNGRPYRAIGRDLLEMGELAREEVSLQSIRAWLREHPAEAPGLMARNPSYVFFRELDVAPEQGPLGAQQVPLTAGRSLAVDRAYIALGSPIWLDTTLADGADTPWQRLMVAQDTGGAIKGVVRGDVFFGSGAEAEALAGPMRQTGRYYLLLPRGVDPLAAPVG